MCSRIDGHPILRIKLWTFLHLHKSKIHSFSIKSECPSSDNSIKHNSLSQSIRRVPPFHSQLRVQINLCRIRQQIKYAELQHRRCTTSICSQMLCIASSITLCNGSLAPLCNQYSILCRLMCLLAVAASARQHAASSDKNH